MGIFYYEEHATCKHYASDVRVGFKYVEVAKDEELVNENKDINYLIFIRYGSAQVSCDTFKECRFNEGEMFLVPHGSDMHFKVTNAGAFLVFIFETPDTLCETFYFQSLITYRQAIKYEFKGIEIRQKMRKFLSLIVDYLEDGISCKHMHELKQRELFLIMRSYYTKDELAMLFYPIIGVSLDFKSMVLKNYLKSTTVVQLASICGTSLKLFTDKFKQEFGDTPYQWMQKQKKRHIMDRLAAGNTPIKDIVDEFGFASQAHLNRYCEKYLGSTAAELRRRITSDNK